MSIVILGDIHGLSKVLGAVDEEVSKDSKVVAGIQVGDMGWYEDTLELFHRLDLKLPWYWIDGNHEDFSLLKYKEVTEVAPNLFYVPRGTVMEIDGITVGFLGGAASVDKMYRLKQNMHWSEEELITDEDIAKFDGISKVDLLITHCPPQSFIQKHFDPRFLLYFGLSESWRDPSADKVEALWERLGKPPLVCGHMHKSITDDNIRLLDCNEYITVNMNE
jgi:predicted phosphodiesterase